MRRWRIIVPMALCLAGALLLLVLLNLSKADPNAPKFVRAIPQPVGPYRSLHYDWGGAVPFQGGKVWVSTVSGSNTNYSYHTYLYDLNSGQSEGELLHAGPVFSNADQSRLLCEGRGVSAASLIERIATWIGKVSNRKIVLKPNSAEFFWILDLRDNSATRVGELSQIAGSGSRWKPSPGFRYGYNVPSNSDEGSSFFLCDLENKTMKKIRFRGQLKGWWDEENIVMEDEANNVVLLNIATTKTTNLFSANSVSQFLEQSGLTNDSRGLDAFSNWNGQEYDFFFTARGKRYSYQESFLLKADRNGPKLTLLHTNFQFKHLGFLNAAATHYVYNGESGTPGQGGNGGVFLRDIANNTTHTLVQPNGSGQYAIPRFYKDSVIYFRSRLLWRVDLNGSNNVPLFPP